MFSRFFNRESSFPQYYEENDIYQLDSSLLHVKELESSFEALRQSATEVSSAAIDAAKVLREQLEDSEDRFLSTIDSIEDFVLIKDARGRWKILNKYGQSLFNFYHGEFYDKTDAELAVQYPKFAETLKYCQQTDIEAWANCKPSRSEKKIPYPDGHVYLDIIKTPTFEDDGSRKELITVGRDVTDSHLRSKREKACFQALNSASDAILILDSKANIFFCNDQFIETFGLNSYQDIIDKHIIRVLPDIPNFDKLWAEIRQNKQLIIEYPSINQTLSIIPMMNSQSYPVYYVCTFKGK